MCIVWGASVSWTGERPHIDQKWQNQAEIRNKLIREQRSCSGDDGRNSRLDVTADTNEYNYSIHQQHRASLHATESVPGMATSIGRAAGAGSNGTVSMVMHGSRVKSVGKSPLQRQTLVGKSIHKWPSIGHNGRYSGAMHRTRRGEIRKGGVRR